jgi:beta-lactamase class A
MKTLAAIFIFSYISMFSGANVIAENLQYEASKNDLVKLSALKAEIKNYLGKNISKVGLVYHDLNSGNKITINENKSFLAASTVKVQINMVLCDMFLEGSVSPKEKLSYSKDCFEGGTGILQNSKSLKAPISIKTLSKYSIVHSDNIATRMIMKRLGGRNKIRTLIDKKLGHTTDHSNNYITPKDESVLLELLYENPNNNPYYDNLLSTMKNTVFHDRLDRYLPRDIIAHKIGTFKGYTHDVGIIDTKIPYILCIYTEGLPNGNKVIADISKFIYDRHQQIFKP